MWKYRLFGCVCPLSASAIERVCVLNVYGNICYLALVIWLPAVLLWPHTQALSLGVNIIHGTDICTVSAYTHIIQICLPCLSYRRSHFTVWLIGIRVHLYFFQNRPNLTQSNRNDLDGAIAWFDYSTHTHTHIFAYEQKQSAAQTFKLSKSERSYMTAGLWWNFMQMISAHTHTQQQTDTIRCGWGPWSASGNRN